MRPSSAYRDPSRLPGLLDASRISIHEVDFDALDTIRRLNTAIFAEERVINTFEREDLMMLMAYVDEKPVGFKIGYRQDLHTYYSAKGGVLEEYRRMGLARALLFEMIERIRAKGYIRLAYDTFPNKHPGMTILGLQEGFRVVKADFNTVFHDYRLRMEKQIQGE